MCGIVGLLVLDPALEPSLGAMVAPMVSALGTRGPDSTGIAVYSQPDEGRCRVSIRRSSPDLEWDTVCIALGALGDGDTVVTIESDGDAGLLSSPGSIEATLAGLRPLFPAFKVTGHESAVEVIKDIGDGAEVCRRYHIDQRQGFMALGHTRMATESAVTWAHSLGMPNPGLLPTAKEREAQRPVVADAIAGLEQLACDVDGQVAMTRHPARTIAAVARNRRVHRVLIEQPKVGAARRFLEGDMIASVRRRLGGSAEVVVIDSLPGPAIGANPGR